MGTVTDTTGRARRVTRSEEIDLATISDAFPEGTTINLSVRGTPDAFTVECEHNGERYIIEGAGTSAELTGVLGAERTPERVPDWLAAVLAETCDVCEVSVYR